MLFKVNGSFGTIHHKEILMTILNYKQYLRSEGEDNKPGPWMDKPVLVLSLLVSYYRVASNLVSNANPIVSYIVLHPCFDTTQIQGRMGIATPICQVPTISCMNFMSYRFHRRIIVKERNAIDLYN